MNLDKKTANIDIYFLSLIENSGRNFDSGMQKRRRILETDSTGPWADLPPELLDLIHEKVDSHSVHLRYFRAVCQSWRRACISLPSSPNLLNPNLPCVATRPHRSDSGLNSEHLWWSKNFVLNAGAVFLIHAPIQRPQVQNSSVLPDSPCWLLFVDELNPGKLCIRHPLMKSTLLKLPFNDEGLNFLDLNAREITRYYSLNFVDPRGKAYRKPEVWAPNYDRIVYFPDTSGFVVLCNTGVLWVARLAVGTDHGTDHVWKKIRDPEGLKYDDIVDYRGEIYAVNRRGKLSACNYNSLEMRKLVPRLAGGGGWRKRLVESLGRLFLIVRCPVADVERSARFIVYKPCEEMAKWVEVASLEDQVFFVGLDFSFSISAQDLSGLYRANSILFMEDSFPNYGRKGYDHSLFENVVDKEELPIGVFNLSDGTYGLLQSYPGCSAVLWPPPAWLGQDDMSLIIEGLRASCKIFQLSIQPEGFKVGSSCSSIQKVCESEMSNIRRRSGIHFLASTAEFFQRVLVDYYSKADVVTTRMEEDFAQWMIDIKRCVYLDGWKASKVRDHNAEGKIKDFTVLRGRVARLAQQVEIFCTLFAKGVQLLQVIVEKIKAESDEPDLILAVQNFMIFSSKMNFSTLCSRIKAINIA